MVISIADRTRAMRVFFESIYAWKFDFAASLTTKSKAETEFNLVKSWLANDRPPEVDVIFDTSISPSGLGDWALEVTNANFLSTLGFKVNLFLLDDGRRGPGWEFLSKSEGDQRVAEFVKFGSLYHAPTVELILTKEHPSSENHVLLFSSSHANRKDPNINILAFLDRATTLNPEWISELSYIPRANSKGKIDLIGVAVRQAGNQQERNPDLLLVAKDIELLMKKFPEAKIKIFTDSQHLEQVLVSLQNVLPHFAEIITGQSSKSFETAFGEALACDLWIQRDGGGIGMAPTFSNRPYIFISHHTIGARLFGFDNGKYGSWSRINQIYILSPFKKLRHISSIKLALRKIIASNAY